MEALMQRSLDPLDPAVVANPSTYVYPDDLDTITLQGYLGEVIAGLVAENFEPHGTEWTVPAFLFRHHSAGSQALERRRQLGGPARAAPGRTGDDALAFQVDDGHVTAWLFGEAKCTTGHDSGLISDGHKQFVRDMWLPIDLMQLVEVLQQRGSGTDRAWADALQELFLKDRATAPPRTDMFVYVCGKSPTQKNRSSWMSETTVHADYAGGRDLEAVEVHLGDIDSVLTAVYPAHTIMRRKGSGKRKATAKRRKRKAKAPAKRGRS